MAAIAHNRICKRSTTPIKDPTVKLKLATAQIELATTILQNQVLKSKVLLRQNQAPALTIGEPPIGEPPTGERVKYGTEDGQALWE